jgi:hypothetical protein
MFKWCEVPNFFSFFNHGQWNHDKTLNQAFENNEASMLINGVAKM